MFRSILFIVLISLISLTSAKSEDHPWISLRFCLDSSTVILKGRVIDEDGRVKIVGVIKGTFHSKEVQIHELRGINKYGDYSPKMKADWEVIIFLKKSEQNVLVPVFYWDNTSYQLPKAMGYALSTVWFKDGKAFYSMNGADDEVMFVQQGEQRDLEGKIKEHVRIEKDINRIEKYPSCRKKFDRLEKLYNESIYSEMIYDAMLRTECGDQILAFVRPIALDTHFTNTYMQRKMLPAFVEYGKQQIVPDLESMFDKEFKFWKAYIGVPERRLWWQLYDTLQMRFAIFSTLMHLMIENQLGDWELHANEVINYFGSLEAYRANTGYSKLHESVELCLEQRR